MQTVVNMPWVFAFLLLAGSVSLGAPQVSPPPARQLLLTIMRTRAVTNVPVREVLFEFARASSVALNVEVHQVKGPSPNIDAGVTVSWEGGTDTIAHALTELRRRAPAFTWMEIDDGISLVVRDALVREDALQIALAQDHTFSGSQIDFVVWLGKMFPHLAIVYRQQGGMSELSKPVAFTKGATLREILTSYSAHANMLWSATIEYDAAASTQSGTKQVVSLSFVTRGTVRNDNAK